MNRPKKTGNSGSKGTMAGQVKTAAGKPVVDAAVLIGGDSPSHKDIAPLTNEQGNFRLDDLNPGDYTIMVNAENYPPHTIHTQIKPGQVTHLEIVLK